jgi:hypothetical protein
MRTAALAVLGFAFTATVALADDVVKHPFQSAIARGQVQRVVIDIPAGEINVRNGASDKLVIAGVSKRDYQGAKERAWAQKVVDDTTVEIYVSGPEAIIRRKFGAAAKSFRAQKFTSVEMTIDVPRGVDVFFETTFGEVNLDGEFGNVDVDLRAGEIDFRTPRAGVRQLNASCRVGEVRAHLGDQVVTREGVLPGKTNFFNAAGKTQVNLHVTAGEVDVTLTGAK